MSNIIEVIVPPNEEGTRATVLRWCRAVGDRVAKDEPLVELETDKVTVEIASPCTGTLVEILKQVDAEVVPGDVLARFGPADESSAANASAPNETIRAVKPAAGMQPKDSTDHPDDGRPLSPAVRRLLQEHALAAPDVQGTGKNGRLTARDVIRHGSEAGAACDAQVPHTSVRRRVAEHMARSLREAPHVTTLFEADLTRVLSHRQRHAASYESRGARLTLTAYFVSACARALRAHPELNSTFLPDALQLHVDINIGVGTALGSKGLIVPVIHRAQGLDLFGIAQRLGYLVEAARAGRLTPEEVRGGTFTISNHGVGGSLLAAPIVINQPQVAILGVGKVERRVCVIGAGGEEAIGVRSMCYLTLSIDHRALDAFQANAFLSLVVTTLEQWRDEVP